MSWWIILLVLCSRYYQIEARSSCSSKEYEKDGRCCSLCRPGERLDKECTKSSETICVACKTEEYQDKWNQEPNCLPHQYCDENLGFQKISEGTPERNVDCVCQDGKHCSSTECETCVLNTPCGPGYGVTRKAEKNSDTECAPCPSGTFSNVTSDTELCKDWQRCTSSQLEIRPGTPITDVVCGPRPKSSTWIYIVVILMILIIGLLVFFFIRKKRRGKKVKVTQPIQVPPEVDNEDEPFVDLPKPNLPEEDQDITMQGLPVAQEQGKDYHMSQEEV